MQHKLKNSLKKTSKSGVLRTLSIHSLEDCYFQLLGGNLGQLALAISWVIVAILLSITKWSAL